MRARHPTAAALLALGAVAGAHTGAPPTPHDLWTSWTLAPLPLLALAGWAYARGFRNARRHAARHGRGVGAVTRRHALLFAWAQVALFVALVSPLDALGTSLLSAHMAQHLLLLVVAPPLLVASAPGYVLAWALPVAARRRLARGWNRSGAARAWRAATTWLFTPLGASLLFALVVWAWHAQPFYQAALTHPAVHVLEHLTFLAAAYPFWAVVAAPLGRRAAPGVGIAMLFGASVQGGALGALMTFAPSVWYPAYAATTPAWGLTALQDQQLAGLLMWKPPGAVYVALVCLLAWRWLRGLEGPPAGARPALSAARPRLEVSQRAR